MRIVTNEELVERNKKFATRLFFFSLLVLIAGFVAANASLLGIEAIEQVGEELYLLIMPFVLLVGFTSTMISVRMTNLWVRQPRPEEAIQNSLKGLSNKSALYNYLHFPARHVLISPQGVFPIVTRFQEGRYKVDQNKWRSFRGIFGMFFAIFRLDGIGNPTLEAQEAEQFIRYITEDYDENVPVQPLIIFVDPRATLEIGETDIPVLYADPKKDPNLKDYLRDYRKENGDYFEGDELREFIEAFEEATLD